MDSTVLKSIGSRAMSEGRDYLNLPSKEAFKDIDWLSISSIIAGLGAILILILFSAFVLWLLRAIALYSMANKKGDKLAFLAFIPYACLFVTGRIVGKTRLFGIDIDKPEYLLPLLLASMYLPFAGVLSSILFIFFYYGLLYKLYKQKWEGFAVVAIILSIFIPILQPLFLFYIKSK